MDNSSTCIWATKQELWDSFLNDPALAKALDAADNKAPVSSSTSDSGSPECQAADDEHEQNIGARLRAYATPITDEVLRQSIR